MHPRIGATDVVPFVPIREATLADCVALSVELGQRIGDELAIPVYLYEAAATRPERRNLADVRRGGYEGLKRDLGSDPQREPDFGPATIGSAGATAVGARAPLIAYNIYLNTADVEVAKCVARAIRFSNGGLEHCKALGLLVGGRAQVSINITDFRRTPLQRIFELVRSEAARYGAMPAESEVIGLVPEDALLDAAEHYLQLNHFRRDQILERRLRSALRDEGL
ncbi:MAG: Glutamate formiminotransferase @ Glutamate formyltransferase [uncultured Chloroflexia bacterium]|uniref:glutamate formimidoyltransferase n=1 Tax=uncultured Chloroflexia bacterium TaxID=1672391 RepID=A0A6J4I7P2_9CHLR|nr:MAG: Glutamate formiminotransferase @ Glutamate formyltransferase [uncultured Chloroflexia bacterium]